MADKTVQLVEANALGKPTVDREQGVIRGVRLLGDTAPKKNRDYDHAAMREAAPRYNGRPVNIDHGKGPRSLEHRFGRIENAKFDEANKAIVGDLRYNKGHKLAEAVAYAAEHLPDTLGLSHIADGRVTVVKGRERVTAILEVNSVDLVSDPATNRTLFESEHENGAPDMSTKTLAEANIEDLKEANPGLLKTLTESIKAELAEANADKSKDEQIAKLTESNAALKAEIDGFKKTAARSELVAKKLTESKLPANAVTDTFRKTLMEAADDKAIDALIADRKAIAGNPAAKPESRRLAESNGNSPDLASLDSKSFAALVTAR